MKFSQLVARFVAWASKCKKPSTVAVYRHYLLRFCEATNDPDVTAVTPADLTAWAKTWHDVQAVKRLYRWAVNEAKILSDNPVIGVPHPPKGQRRRIITQAEWQAFLRASSPDLRRLLVAYRETMARPGELRHATWADVLGDDPNATTRERLSSQRACIVLDEFKDRCRRSDSEAPRIIILSPVACRLLLWLLPAECDTAARIFVTRRGQAWTPNALRCRFRALRKKLSISPDKRGETIVPYTLRHTSATEAAAAGVRDRILADVLGHVETKTTARYLHLQLDHLREALKKHWKPR